MKAKRNLIHVVIWALVILVCGLNLAPSAQAVNSITNIVPTPASPSALLNSSDVGLTFNYTTDQAGGVRIQSRPYTNGSPTPSYAVCGSPLYPLGSSNGACTITVTSGDVVVDQIQLRMYTADWSVVLVEFYLNVEYHFGNSITNINLVPASPAQLGVSQQVTVSLDCVTQEAGGVLIYHRPRTNGSFTPGYGHSGSKVYFGVDSGVGFFQVDIGNERIDEINFQMWNLAQTVLLLEVNVPVDYHVCSAPCIWYVDAGALGANTGFNWANAFNNLQDALAVAWPGEQIWVAQGTYKPDQGSGQIPGDRTASFALIDDVGVYGGFNGTESSVSARNIVAYPTILSGEIGAAGMADNSYHVIRSTGNGNTALLDGFTVTGGNADGTTTPIQIGGGIILESNASPTIANTLFIANNAVSGGGLGAWQGGASSILNCDFIDNVANGGTGGGIYLQAHNPTIRSTRFIGNSAQRGGGLYALNNTAPFELRNCLFNCNAAISVSAGGGGGAIYSAGIAGNPNPNPPDLINCTLVYNTSTLPGGGIYNNGVGGTDITLDSCILWFNSDPAGMVESSQYTAAGGAPSIQYSNIQGWTGALGGVGNIGTDPLFADADGIDDTPCTPDDDFRLIEGSPSIDTGNPNAAFNDPDGSRNDMGVFGGPGGEEGGVGAFPGSGFIFTTVGVIPTSEITQTNIDPALIQGTANVSPAAAADLSIPAYTNTALGRSLWLHGLFGDADTQVDFYRVQAGPWSGNTPPAEVDFGNLDDKLVKVLYTYNPILGEWTSQRITLGPQVIDGVTDLYQLTTTGFWSLIDLRLVWNTRNYANGKYTLRIKAYHQNFLGAITDVTASLGAVADVILYIDNSPVTATIHSVKYDPTNPNYDPLTDGDIPTCGIISLVSNTENLRFNVTASHPNGFLRLWRLDALFGSNQNAGIIAGQSYSTPPALWSGITSQEFASMDAAALAPWVQCAYQFRLRSWARVTNGFGFIISSTFNEHLTLDLGGGGCSRADIDNSGVVDILDLGLLGLHWLESCN